MRNIQLDDIKEIFKRIARGDTAAYEHLYVSVYSSIYAIAFTYGKTTSLAEDVVQQVFLKIWERRIELDRVDNPEGWLHNAAKFQILDALKKEWSTRDYLARVADTQTSEQNDPAIQLMESEQRKIVEEAIENLPHRQREVYRLSREEGLSYMQIAQQLQVSRETVKEHMARALKTLREKLGSMLISMAPLLLKIFF